MCAYMQNSKGFVGTYNCRQDLFRNITIPMQLSGMIWKETPGDDRIYVYLRIRELCLEIYTEEGFNNYIRNKSDSPDEGTPNFQSMITAVTDFKEVNVYSWFSSCKINIKAAKHIFRKIWAPLTIVGCGDHIEVWKGKYESV